MNDSQIESRIREAEDRVRALLVRTSQDDSFACQVELRTSVEKLRELRTQRYGQSPGEAVFEA